MKAYIFYADLLQASMKFIQMAIFHTGCGVAPIRHKTVSSYLLLDISCGVTLLDAQRRRIPPIARALAAHKRGQFRVRAALLGNAFAGLGKSGYKKRARLPSGLKRRHGANGKRRAQPCGNLFSLYLSLWPWSSY